MRRQHRSEIFYSNSYLPQDFPQADIIQSIRIGILNEISDSTISDSSVYVSAVYSNVGQFVLQISSARDYLLTFEYTGSLWITARTENAFGFLKLRYVPNKGFRYFDKGQQWALHKNCYTRPLVRDGLHSLYINDFKLPQTNILQLRTGGQIETQTSRTDSNAVVVNIGRSADSTQGYYQMPQSTEYYIRTVNGYSVSNLQIVSSDSAISCAGPYRISDDVYALYIKTKKGFPVCPEWSDS